MHGKSGDTVNRGPVNRGMTVTHFKIVCLFLLNFHNPVDELNNRSVSPYYTHVVLM